MLNQIWALDMGYTNYLLAQQKLVFKQRTESKVTKRYRRAKTPFVRTLAYQGMADADRDRSTRPWPLSPPGFYRQMPPSRNNSRIWR